jgi:hypothetical protein
LEPKTKKPATTKKPSKKTSNRKWFNDIPK